MKILRAGLKERLKRSNLMRFSFLILLFFLGSCAERSYNLVIEEINLTQIVETIKKRNSDITSVKGLARVSMSSKNEKAFFDQVTIAQKSGLLRLEALAAFGTTVAQVISDEKKVYFTTRNEKLIFEDLEEFNFSYIYPDLPQDIKIINLVNVLLGSAPFSIWNDDFSVDFTGMNNEIKLNFKRDDNLTIVLNTEINVIDKISYFTENREKVEISFDNFVYLNNNIYFPKNILIISGEYALGIKYNDDVIINEKLNISIFKPNV